MMLDYSGCRVHRARAGISGATSENRIICHGHRRHWHSRYSTVLTSLGAVVIGVIPRTDVCFGLGPAPPEGALPELGERTNLHAYVLSGMSIPLQFMLDFRFFRAAPNNITVVCGAA